MTVAIRRCRAFIFFVIRAFYPLPFLRRSPPHLLRVAAPHLLMIHHLLVSSSNLNSAPLRLLRPQQQFQRKDMFSV